MRKLALPPDVDALLSETCVLCNTPEEHRKSVEKVVAMLLDKQRLVRTVLRSLRRRRRLEVALLPQFAEHELFILKLLQDPRRAEWPVERIIRQVKDTFSVIITPKDVRRLAKSSRLYRNRMKLINSRFTSCQTQEVNNG